MPVFFMRRCHRPEISVIIPSRDGSCDGNVEDLLASLQRQQGIERAEVILVVAERPNGHARNVGVAASSGRWLVFMDDDAGLRGTEVLQRLVQPFEEADASAQPIGMTGSATALPPDSNSFQRRLARADPRALFAETDEITETDMAHHLCCALPRRVWDEIGGESDHLETGTDVDLRHRLRNGGYRIVVVPHTVATHPQPRDLGAFWRKQLWYGSGKVALDRLHPSSRRNRIGDGRLAAARYLARALITFPMRTLRLDRASPVAWRPLLAVGDLAQKIGYARAWMRQRRGVPVSDRSGWLSSRRLLQRLPPPAPSAPPAADGVRKLLVVATAGVGDALALLPTLAALRRHHAQAEITGWVSRRGAGEVLSRAGVVDRVELRNLSDGAKGGRLQRKIETVLWLREEGFDLAVVNYINSNEETALLLRLGGVGVTAGYADATGPGRWFHLSARRPPAGSGRSALQRHAELLPLLGVTGDATALPGWRIREADRVAAEQVWSARGGPPRGARVIGLHPGCGADMKWKRWPEERFIALARSVMKAGVQVAVFGGPDETELAARVTAGAGEECLDLSGPLSLGITAALLERTDLLVANDSGLYNLAQAIPVPVVALFGPSPPDVSGPWPTGLGSRLISREVPCRPCYDFLQPPDRLPCPVDRACITEIDVDEVLEACRPWLPGGRHTKVASPPPPGPSLAGRAG